MFPLVLVLGAALVLALVIVFAAVIVYPSLPSIETLKNYQPKVPLRIYSVEGSLIGEFGVEHRAPIKIEDVPQAMRAAIVAAEDERFYEHGGVDYVGVMRAAVSNFISGGAAQGASTITMQVARNFFLSNEKTLSRKFNEVLLAFKIEHSLTKDQILELYMNQINLGQRAYGFGAAAQTYFSKPLNQLSLAEMAMLAGLPKAPSRYNPVVNPKRAKQRQLYVLHRMRDLDFISDEQLQAAEKQPLIVHRERNAYAVKADYFAETVRQMMYDRFKESAYTQGFKVYTTLVASQQQAAYDAVRKGALDYDHRHGYRGAERYVDIPVDVTDDALEELLQDEDDSDGISPALVLDSNAKLVKAYCKGVGTIEIAGTGLQFAKDMLSSRAPTNQRLRRGALIRVQQDNAGNWQIVQLPQVEAALVSLDPQDGAVHALVGGFDFDRNKYNHITQAWRQPGSSFKPFIYSGALEKGFTPATIINDAPLVFDAGEADDKAWEPSNFDGKFDGPIRMRVALAKSKNLVSIRILQAITPQYAQEYIARFGFDPKRQPPYLSMALGSGTVTPMQLAAGYAVFANGGYRVTPYFITRIEDANGNVISNANPLRAGEDAQRIIDERNAFVMTTMLQDVTRIGTAARASELGRGDLAGKTGTTNQFVDAWFCGFGTGLVAVTWIGYDNPHTLGTNETGAATALPMWVSYMGKALKGVPEAPRPVPEGVVTAHIDPQTGLRVADGGIVDYFYQEYLPPESGDAGSAQSSGAGKPSDEAKDQLF